MQQVIILARFLCTQFSLLVAFVFILVLRVLKAASEQNSLFCVGSNPVLCANGTPDPTRERLSCIADKPD